MKYYLKKCTHQELGSIDESGRPKRGRYLLTSMNENILEMFPPLSVTQLNDSALLPVIPLYSGKKIYCNYVYHNDKFHGSTAKHPRNEYRIYLNKKLEEDRLLFSVGDIIVMRIARDSDEENNQDVYYLDFIKKDSSVLYKQLDQIISDYPIAGGYGIYEGDISEFEDRVHRIMNLDDCEVEIDASVTQRIPAAKDAVASLFNSASFRDFVMVGYKNLCAVTGMVIRYGTYMNLEAAHIRPKSHGGLYLPSNGIALCRDLHWAFDKGFFTLNDHLEIMVHPKSSSNYLNAFDSKKIRVPDQQFFAPDLENVAYHRKNIYGLFLTSGRL